MADNPARTLSAAFPTPPPFYKDFTKDNVSQVRKLQKASTGEDDQIDNSGLAAHLRNLIPPEPPADGRYKSFGIQHDLNQPDQSLSAAGIQQLYPSPPAGNDSQPNPTPHLLTLTKAILLNFLELVGVLSVNPAHHADKIEHLQTLFYNVHDLINQFRPHQARESLILMMEEQVDKIKAEIGSVKESREKMESLLKTIQEQGAKAQADLGGATSSHAPSDEDKALRKRQDMQRRQWAALEDEIG